MQAVWRRLLASTYRIAATGELHGYLTRGCVLEWASANAALMAQGERFEADMKAAITELEKKHAFERG